MSRPNHRSPSRGPSLLVAALLGLAGCDAPPAGLAGDDALPESDDPGGKEDGLTRPLGTYRAADATGDLALLVVLADKTYLGQRRGDATLERGTVRFTTGGATRYLRLKAGTADRGRYAYTVDTGALRLRRDTATTWQPLAHSEPPACDAAGDCDRQGLAPEAGCGAWACTAASCARSCSSTPATQNWKRDVVSTALAVDVAALSGSATVVLAPDPATGASFDVRGLDVRAVKGPAGPLAYAVTAGRLDVGVAPSTAPVKLTVDYGFRRQANFDGLLAGGSTFTWPYFCGNLFPCRTDPSDGLRFELAVTGVGADQVAVFPRSIPGDAPPYMLAWAVGRYTRADLGRTKAGTKVAVYSLPGTSASTVTRGTALLTASFGWAEERLGPYLFGEDVASVDVTWGDGGSYGGMEHHPYWHVSHGAMGDRVTHVHEALHGWFGNGVRIACWEDFVLSEGTVTYLTAKALGAAGGAAVEDAVWAEYEGELANGIATEDTIAWPEGCGTIDVLTSGLYSSIPYQKGAQFYRAVEKQVGAAALERAIARFYAEHAGGSARMQEMLDVIRSETGYDATALSRGWLRSRGRPK